MLNQQLIDWIRSQESQGYSPQQIYTSLIQQGYTPNDINEALNLVSGGQMPQQTNSSPKSFSFLPILIIGIVVVALIGGGIIWFMSQDKERGSNAPVNSEEILNNKESTNEVESKPVNNIVPDTPPKEVTLDANCDVFPNKLDSCIKYKCQFTHPFTGESMVKEILGIVDGKCNYVEEMPNKGKMECKYTESMRKAAAQYYKDVAAAESAGVEVQTELGTGKAKIKYTIDSKEVENPLQEAMTNGQCIISGY